MRAQAASRVIDASIRPTIASGNISVPAITIAERAVDAIRRDAR